MNAGLSVKPTMEEVWTLDSSEDDSSEDCTKLTQIKYDGVKSEFEAIKKPSDFWKWNTNSNITKVLCKDGVINITPSE